MLRHIKDGIEWLTFDLFADCKSLNHGILSRKGGFSSNEFSSLNVKFGLGDDPLLVKKNLKKISKVCCLPPLFTSYQDHGNTIWEVERNTQRQNLVYADALVTNIPGKTLFITHADCQAAIFYDPQEHVLANVHSGWRGNVRQIYQKVVDYLYKKFRSKPQNILVGISPSLGPMHSEFINYKKEFPKEFWDFQIKPFYFDLWAIAKMQLESCGILPSHIEIAEIDTYDSPHDFFSFRRDRETGRNGTFANLLKRI